MISTVIGAPAEPRPSQALSPQTRRMLEAPILPMLLGMAWPNILILAGQTSTGLIETWWLSRLGTDALAGMALAFPPVMLMQMMSGGALGGGISAAVARALGGGRRDEGDAFVLHAILASIGIALVFSGVMLTFGRPIYTALGGTGAALETALTYSGVVFAGNALLWLMNALASVIRGTGEMLVPALVTCIGAVLLIPLSPLLIFGLGPVPPLGVAGAGAAVVTYYAGSAAVLGWYVLSGRNLVRFRWTRLRWGLFADILRVGAVAAVSSLMINVTLASATALVAYADGIRGMAAYAIQSVAGFGIAARLEYLLVPLVFGIGGPLVALVGANIGAGDRDRALRIALIGGAVAFGLAEAIGLAAARWPMAWMHLFTWESFTVTAGLTYLQIVGPTFGFFGLGLSLYFASQGAGRLKWPLLAGALRMLIGLGGGWLLLRLTGSVLLFFGALALGLVAYGVTLGLAIRAGVWFRSTSA